MPVNRALAFKKIMKLSSPNKMIWSCFRSIHRNIKSLDSHDSEEDIKDIAASTILLAVTAVETFINMYFRVLVEEEKYKPHKDMVLSDSISKDGVRAKGLKQKLNRWPNKVLGKNINFNAGIGKEFDDLRKHRNDLTHFTSDYKSLTVGNITIEGLANTEAFDKLNKDEAINSARIAKEFIEHILSLSGINNGNVQHAVHQWTGITPTKQS